MKTDIEIAQEASMQPIGEVAEKLGIDEDYLEYYGKYKAKLSPKLWEKIKNNKNGKLILVTSINPTPAGEGKSTITVGLGQALNKLGKKVCIALREPSLGPCMGIKGGAAGGGYSQVVPMEDINLHFTGDMHAIESAHNLLSAMIDNHIQQGNELNIDLRRITWKRAIDMNDRALREIVVGLGGKANGYPRQDGFIIAVASEIMAILCLSKDLMDLKEKLGKIIIGYNKDGIPITAKDLKAEGAMTLLLKDAIKPNLVQTLENVPAFIHGGPFANIAHGCNSLVATKYGLKLSDYLVTEAGFGADLGAEKFFDIKCRYGNLRPSAAVIVATIRALKMHGGLKKDELFKEDLDALKRGMGNLEKQIENVEKYGIPVVVAINRFSFDTEREIELLKTELGKISVDVALTEVYEKGGAGGLELARKVISACEKQSDFHFLYDTSLSVKEKIDKIAKEIYGADSVEYAKEALKDLKNIEKLKDHDIPICIAKTQYSLSDDPKLLGRPKGFKITVRELKVSQGAGFIVAMTGNIMTMPGLPKHPAAEKMDIDKEGKITGLF